jgi:hypothetical protein
LFIETQENPPQTASQALKRGSSASTNRFQEPEKVIKDGFMIKKGINLWNPFYL